ncbi:MAG: DUF3365 domain-containing protein [Burkholderiales bacterium]|nr:DUF3365 domain-containing protein [Burkholderiales bacterium]
MATTSTSVIATKSVISKYRALTVGLIVFWTVCVGASLWINIDRTYRHAEEAAGHQARTAFDKDVIYRRWSSRLGGVYAKVTETTPPNPYLRDPERDISGAKGEPLTKINPAYMTRIVHELGELSSGIVGHITSNNPIRPGNEPDPWEARALTLLESHPDMKEFSERQIMNGKPYLRFIGPLITEESCMGCHAFQGYKVGEQRGGISVSVPMEPFLVQANSATVFLGISHAGLWLFGVVFFFMFIRNLIKSDEQIAMAQEETTEILTTVHEGLFLLDKNGKMGTQFSASLPGMMRREIQPGMDFTAILREMVPQKVFENATSYIELLLGNRVKESLVADLNPLNEVEIEGDSGAKHYLSFNFNRVLEEGEISHLLVTVQDVTERVYLEQQLEAAKDRSRKEVEVLLNLLQKDPVTLQQFFTTTEQSLTQINERLRNDDDTMEGRMHILAYIMRVVHGIKGEAAALGAEMFESYAHSFEQELVVMRERGEVRGEDIVRITVLLEGFYERLASMSSIATRAVGSPSASKDGAAVPTEGAEEKIIKSFEENIRNLAQRIAIDDGKQVVVVTDIAQIATLPRRITKELGSIAVQLVRNAVKHGIEPLQDRIAQGKSPHGEIQISCRETEVPDQFDFVVRDNGRGISVARIRKQLITSGRMSAAEAEALNAKDVIMKIFETGFSTAEEADRDAGRGVGMDVIADKVLKIRGNLMLNSKIGEFTEFRVRFDA